MSGFDCIIQIETVKNVQMIKGGERMLLEERLDEIVKIVNERGSISNQELVKMLGASESTIRRDITTLANDNRVIRVHGGAMSVVSGGGMEDSEVSARRIQNSDEKIKIAKYAASLINDGDLVYIDAGTTTEYMIEYIPPRTQLLLQTLYLTQSVLREKALKYI